MDSTLPNTHDIDRRLSVPIEMLVTEHAADTESPLSQQAIDICADKNILYAGDLTRLSIQSFEQIGDSGIRDFFRRALKKLGLRIHTINSHTWNRDEVNRNPVTPEELKSLKMKTPKDNDIRAVAHIINSGGSQAALHITLTPADYDTFQNAGGLPTVLHAVGRPSIIIKPDELDRK